MILSERQRRITEIVIEMMNSMIEKGDLDPDDRDAMEASMRQCFRDVKAVYDAAVEFVS